MLEFINTNKPAPKKSSSQDTEKLDNELNKKINEEIQRSGTIIKQSPSAYEEANVKQLKHKGCIDKPYFLVKVKIKLAYLEAFFIHPDNSTYPVFSIKVGHTAVDYRSKCDHDEIELMVKDL